MTKIKQTQQYPAEVPVVVVHRDSAPGHTIFTVTTQHQHNSLVINNEQVHKLISLLVEALVDDDLWQEEVLGTLPVTEHS